MSGKAKTDTICAHPLTEYTLCMFLGTKLKCPKLTHAHI